MCSHRTSKSCTFYKYVIPIKINRYFEHRQKCKLTDGLTVGVSLDIFKSNGYHHLNRIAIQVMNMYGKKKHGTILI